jgi:WD40 repeat protein
VRPLLFLSRYRGVLFACLLFVVIFAAVYANTPLRPYATLHVPETCHVMRFSPDGGTLLTAGYAPPMGDDRFVKGPTRVWDVLSGTERFALSPDWTFDPQKVCFSPDGRLFAADQAGWELKVWDARTGDMETLYPGDHVGEIFRFSPDGEFLIFETGSDRDRLEFWNVQSRQQAYSLKESASEVTFSADGQSFVTTGRDSMDGTLSVTRVKLWKWDPSQGPVLEMSRCVMSSSIVFSPDLRAYATADGREISLWDMATGTRLFSEQFEESDAQCLCLRFLRGGKMLAAENYDGKTVVWDLAPTPRKVAEFTGPWLYRFWDESAYGAPSPDGQYLAVLLDDEDFPWQRRPNPPRVGARIIRLPTWQETGCVVMEGDCTRLDFHGRRHLAVTFSPDGKYLAVSGLEEPYREPYLNWLLPKPYNPFPASKGGELVRVWDVASRTHLMAFPESSVEFSPDGKVLAVLHDDHVIDLWQLPLEKDLLAVLLWTTAIWLPVVALGCLILWPRHRRKQASGGRPVEGTAAAGGPGRDAVS